MMLNIHSYKNKILASAFLTLCMPSVWALSITNDTGAYFELGLYEPLPDAPIYPESCWDYIDNNREVFTIKDLPPGETVIMGEIVSQTSMQKVCVTTWYGKDPFFLSPVNNVPECKITITNVDYGGRGRAKASEACGYVGN